MTTTETRVTGPYTGSEYLESLRDARTVYFHGERVKDVTTHPAFRNSARSIARDPAVDILAVSDQIEAVTLMCGPDLLLKQFERSELSRLGMGLTAKRKRRIRQKTELAERFRDKGFLALWYKEWFEHLASYGDRVGRNQILLRMSEDDPGELHPAAAREHDHEHAHQERAEYVGHDRSIGEARTHQAHHAHVGEVAQRGAERPAEGNGEERGKHARSVGKARPDVKRTGSVAEPPRFVFQRHPPDRRCAKKEEAETSQQYPETRHDLSSCVPRPRSVRSRANQSTRFFSSRSKPRSTGM